MSDDTSAFPATPREALDLLLAGNQRFTDGTPQAGVGEDDGFIDTHVRHTVDLALDRSGQLADRVTSGRTAAVGLSYRLAEGSVRLVTSRGVDAPQGLATASATAPVPDCR
jgi:carbonic anhydrase